MILAGGMSGDGNLTKTGSGILILSGVSTCSGSTAVTEGILAVLADDASSSFTVGSGAGLFFDGATVHLNSSYVRALAGGAVQYQGATIVGGFLRGPGTQTLPAGSTNNFNATTFNTGATVQQNGNAAFIDVTNVGQLNKCRATSLAIAAPSPLLEQVARRYGQNRKGPWQVRVKPNWRQYHPPGRQTSLARFALPVLTPCRKML